MPYLDNIVFQLNSSIVSSLNFIKADRIQTFGIAETIIDVQNDETTGQPKTIRYPAIINDDGDATMITPDDKYSLMLYHRLETVVNSVVPPKQSFGRSVQISEVNNLSIIVFAFRNKVRRTSYWLEAAMKNKFPDTIKVTDNASKLLSQANVRLATSNFDKLSLLQREYSEINLNYSQLSMFEMKYRLETTFTKGCMDNCSDC
jgi:hypothetical protein